MKNYLPNLTAYSFRPTKIILVGFLLCMQFACATTGIEPYEASYTSKLRGIKVTGTRKLEETGENTYKISWKVKALWMKLNEWSEFEIIDGKYVRPISYHYTRKGLGTDRPVHIEFDWENQRLKTRKGKESKELALHDNVLDKLSYQIQIQLDLLSNPELTELSYEIANHNRIKNYLFNFEKTEQINTKVGNVDALLFSRTKKDGAIQMWLSPSQAYIPVLIKQTEKDKESSVKIKSWTSKGKNLNTDTASLRPEASSDTPFGEDSFSDEFVEETDKQEI